MVSILDILSGAVPLMLDVRQTGGSPKWFPWTRVYQREEWLDQLVSRSDHAALEPAVRGSLFEAIGAAIDDHGGSFVMNFETVLITARRLGYPRDRRSAAS